MQNQKKKKANVSSEMTHLMSFICCLWQELYDYGGGIPNELVVMLERCVGLNARWPGLIPDAYLTYRLYDLPPHTSQTVPCSTDPVFNDATSYPLAVTADVMRYFRSAGWKSHFKFLVLASHLSCTVSSGPAVCGSMFLTTVKIRCHRPTWPRLRSLRALATGREIRGVFSWIEAY